VSPDVLERARERSLRGEPFVLATVVWRRGPSSGKQGSKALIGPDGGVQGWFGGACAEPAVVREALAALADGRPRLMFLGPADELGERREGVVAVPIACQSEGALEVYLEPVLGRPHLVAVGRSPAVDALTAMAGTLGWRATVVDEGGSEADHPGADRVVTSLDLEAAGVTERSLVVVATQGHNDEAALEAALRAKPAYVGLVASRRRARSVLAYLADLGLPAEELRRVRAPAGLDLGTIAHEEIAVAIMAELVKLRAAGEIASGAAVGSRRDEAVDPVCGMTVAQAEGALTASHGGRTYHFCSAGCLASFRADPARYVAASDAGATR
jgi:xanthine dehydrogenase accessory factor